MGIDVSNLFSKWKELVNKMNDKGFPVPLVRHPDSGEGSVSLTLVFLSSILVIIGIVGRWSGKLGGIDMDNAMQFLWTSCSLYFGRSFDKVKSTKDPKTPLEDDNK